MSVLTFRNRKFYLGNAELAYMEARRFAHKADEVAARILKKLFIQQYSGNNGIDFSSWTMTLDKHQIKGIKWILERSRSYLNHAPGAGKTAQVIIASQFINKEHGQTVIICPPQLTGNWHAELKIWNQGKLNLTIIPESAYSWEVDWKSSYIIVPSSMLGKSWVLNELSKLKIKLLAVDEADQFKESSSERTIALFGGKLKSGRASPGLVRKARHTVLMTGSPMPNRATELWAPIYACAPEVIDFMSFTEFGFKYGAPRINDFGKWEFPGLSNADELNKRLTENFMHIVTEDELDHAERLRSMLFMPDGNSEAIRKKWEAKNLSKINMDEISEDASKGALAQFRREIGLKKVAFTAEYAEYRLKQKGERLLIFAWHQDVVEKLAHALRKYRPGVIMGGVDKDLREQHKRNFETGKINLLIGNIKAMGIGHNGMQGADRCLFAEYSWTDEYNTQCEKRVSRKGRDSSLPVRSEYIVMPNSLDEIVLKACFRKQQQTRKVFG